MVVTVQDYVLLLVQELVLLLVQHLVRILVIHLVQEIVKMNVLDVLLHVQDAKTHAKDIAEKNVQEAVMVHAKASVHVDAKVVVTISAINVQEHA